MSIKAAILKIQICLFFGSQFIILFPKLILKNGTKIPKIYESNKKIELKKLKND